LKLPFEFFHKAGARSVELTDPHSTLRVVCLESRPYQGLPNFGW
jgi:hypothetical protein